MNQEQFDNILVLIADPELRKAFKRLWAKYQQLLGAMMYNQTINVYYDKPNEDAQKD